MKRKKIDKNQKSVKDIEEIYENFTIKMLLKNAT